MGCLKQLPGVTPVAGQAGRWQRQAVLVRWSASGLFALLHLLARLHIASLLLVYRVRGTELNLQ